MSAHELESGMVIRIVKTFEDGRRRMFEAGTLLHCEGRNFVPLSRRAHSLF